MNRKKPKVTVEVREAPPGELDEVVLRVDGICLCHLEQMDNNHWWLGIGHPRGQEVHVHLATKKAPIRGRWESEGAVEVNKVAIGKGEA